MFSRFSNDRANAPVEKKLLRDYPALLALYQVYKWLVVIPFLAVTTTFFGTAATILAIVFGPKVATVMGILWSRLNSYVAPMLVEVIGKEKIDMTQSYVIVANHQSHYDIFVIYGWMPVDFRWVMKMELRKVPFLGYSCYRIGHVFIDRSHPDKAKASINAAKERISGGTSIMFFPEGTRSVDGAMHDFKKGAFKFALDMGLPVLPVTIVNTRNVLPAKSMKLFAGKVKLVIQDPIDIGTYSEETMDELMDAARRRIEQGLNQHS
jgi:1-acyl-sn-glycerol-3-phosphate acyltransferase